jgi:MFS transporter, DHA2 family, multidrug resistance protein
MPAMTDTVRASVPERDAGVGSALNEVSRQLGGARGIAVIGSVVNDADRSSLADRTGALDPGAVNAASEVVGVASRFAADLPPDPRRGAHLAAHHAYVDAMTRGFTLTWPSCWRRSSSPSRRSPGAPNLPTDKPKRSPRQAH